MAKRYQQPQTLVGIDKTNGLATDFVVTPAQFVGATVSVTKEASKKGIAFVFPDTNNTAAQIDLGNSAQDIIYLSPGWMLFVFNPGNSATWSGSGTYIANKSDNNSSKGWTLLHINSVISFVIINGSGNKTVTSVSGALLSDTLHTLLIDYGGSPYAADGTRIFVDGIDRTSSSGTGGSGHASDSTQSLRIGNGYYGAAQSSVGKFALAAFGRTRLNDGQIRGLSQNPWQVFKPVQSIFAPTAAGGASALAGNAQAIASASGALSTALPMAGAAVSIATASGQVSAAFPLSGAAAAVASASGNLVLGISLSGTALAQIVASGALIEAFPLAGGANAQMAAGGSMSIQFALAGAAVAQVSATGNLTVGGANALAGNAQVQVAASGSMSVAIPLAGAAQVVASASGDLSTGKQLAGAAVIAAAASGDLKVTVNLSGAAVAQAIAAGYLSIQVPLSGAAVAHVSASGYLSGGQAPLVSDPRYTVSRYARLTSVKKSARSSLVRALSRNFTVTYAH